MASFAKNLAPQINRAIANGEKIDKWPAYFAQIPYAFPTGSNISQDDVYQLGVSAILKKYGWDHQQLNDYYISTLSYRVYTGNTYVWRLSFRIPQEGKLDAFTRFYAGQIPVCVFVRIDPLSGSVIDIQESSDVDQYWFGE